MLQQPQLLQTEEVRFASHSAISANADYPYDAADGDPVTLFFNSVQPEVLLPGAGVPKKSRVLAFQRLRIVVARAEGESCERPVARDLGGVDESAPEMGGQIRMAAHAADLRTQEPAAEQGPDPIIGHLSDALAAAERAGDQHSTIYADAVRLAIVIRQLGQADERRVARGGELPEPAPGARQVRALQKWRLKRVLDLIDNRLSSKITLVDLAAVAGLSRMHFASQFRTAMGMRPHEYLLRQRIRRAEELLLHSKMPIVEIALTVGFQTQAHFTTVFKRIIGHTPCQWRQANVDGLA